MTVCTVIGRRALLAAGLGLMVSGSVGAVLAQDNLYGTAEAPVEIRMIANEAFAGQWQDAMVTEFNKHYPGIKVIIDGVPYPELLAKSLLDATGPEPTYDIIIADDPWIPQLAEAGVLLDLKKDAAQWTDAGYDWDDFNAAPLAASEWKGVQYGVPLRSNLLMMFYNKSLYDKAGVPHPTPDLTWADYMAQGEKLVQDTNGDGQVDAWGVDTYFTRDVLTPTIWQTILNSNGGQLLDENNKAAFNNDLGKAALQTHIDLLKFAPTGGVSHGFNESLQAFRQGQVATMFMWGSVFKGTAIDPKTTTLTPEQVGIQVMPAGTKSAGAHRGIWSGAINNKSRNPAAAWALLQWLSSKDGEAWHSNTLGVFPARKSTLASTPQQEWLGPVFAALQMGYEKVDTGQMWRLRDPKSDAVQQVLADETARAISGQVDVAGALANAEKKINEIMGH